MIASSTLQVLEEPTPRSFVSTMELLVATRRISARIQLGTVGCITSLPAEDEKKAEAGYEERFAAVERSLERVAKALESHGKSKTKSARICIAEGWSDSESESSSDDDQRKIRRAEHRVSTARYVSRTEVVQDSSGQGENQLTITPCSSPRVVRARGVLGQSHSMVLNEQAEMIVTALPVRPMTTWELLDSGAEMFVISCEQSQMD